jgi:hypothetical protein
MNRELQLGCQYYMALKYHMEEAHEENNLDTSVATCEPTFAIFSKKYYNEIDSLECYKKYDYCFIGAIINYKDRKWVIDFAKKYFTKNSIFINTTCDCNWELLGEFDYSNKKLGFCVITSNDNQSRKVQYRIVQENLFYFQTMKQSKFVLCPGGNDAPWSFRFYEVLMCKSIPIVETWHHTYRTKEESTINYKYVLANNVEEEISYDELVDENTILFKKFHMLN